MTFMYLAWLIAGISLARGFVDVRKTIKEWREAGKRWDADAKGAASRAGLDFAVAILAIGALVEDHFGGIATDNKITAAQTTAAAATASAEEARKDLADLERGRHLSEKQKARLLELLSRAPEPRTIAISSEQSDREATDFAIEFQQVFEKSGWAVSRTETMSLWTGKGPPPRGVGVTFNTEAPTDAASAVMLAMRGAEVAFAPLRSRVSTTPLALRIMARGEFAAPEEWGPAVDVRLEPRE
jgi:hypothetical protein